MTESVDPPDHMWRIQDVEFGPTGTTTRYRCDLCLELRTVTPGDPHPVEC